MSIVDQKEYQRIIAEGRIGSTVDVTWDKVLKLHTCCQSRADWCHKMNCPQVIGKDEEIGNEKWRALDFMDKNAYIDMIFA